MAAIRLEMTVRSTLSSLSRTTDPMLAQTRSASEGTAGAFLRLTLDGTSDHTAPPRTTPSFGPVSGILLSAKHSVTVADRLPHTVRYTRLGSLNTGARA